MWTPVDEAEPDPIRALARYYIHDRPSCPRMYGDQPKRIAFTREMAREFRVDGIIGERLLFCDQWVVENYMTDLDLKEDGDSLHGAGSRVHPERRGAASNPGSGIPGDAGSQGELENGQRCSQGEVAGALQAGARLVRTPPRGNQAASRRGRSSPGEAAHHPPGLEGDGRRLRREREAVHRRLLLQRSRALSRHGPALVHADGDALPRRLGSLSAERHRGSREHGDRNGSLYGDPSAHLLHRERPDAGSHGGAGAALPLRRCSHAPSGTRAQQGLEGRSDLQLRSALHVGRARRRVLRRRTQTDGGVPPEAHRQDAGHEEAGGGLRGVQQVVYALAGVQRAQAQRALSTRLGNRRSAGLRDQPVLRGGRPAVHRLVPSSSTSAES